MEEEKRTEQPSGNEAGRRDFLAAASNAAMAGGLIAGYGTFAGMAGRYLYPARSQTTAWQFVATVDSLKVGGAFRYQTPEGKDVTIARQRAEGTVHDFIALSSTCPHLGCQVHWESQNNRFFCPCHSGAFDPSGKAIAGPPAEVGQHLPEYPLKIEDGLLFIEVPMVSLAQESEQEEQSWA